jgi:fibronectin type 3 domain-containing protein
MPNTISAFQVNSLVLDTSLTGVSLSATTWGDYDNDGDLDVVITGTTNGGNTGAIAELYDNDGNGSFTKNTTISNSLIGAYRSGAAFGDYDNDGFLDLVIIGYNTSNSPTTTLYHNNGNGTFSSVSGTGFSNGSWASASWGDANNDGYLDLFLGGLPGGSGRFNTIYLNDKDGTFTNANAGILGSAGGDFVHADYDNDGDLDVAIAGFTDASGVQSKFYRNDNGTYNEVSSISNILYANDNATMEWGDYDNDGDLDLFNAGGNGAQLLINNGNGGLSNSGLSFTSVYESAADWIDYDLDGDLDLLYIGNISGSKSFLYDNNGDGTFTLNTSFSISGAEQGTVDWVDIDNDGDPDLLITGQGISGLITTIYENTSTTTNSAPTLPSLNIPTEINGTYTFTWGASTDNEGGAISYNAFVYDKDNNEYLLHPQSDSLTGFRKVTGIGNAGIDTVLILNSTSTNISWGVQAIDAAGKPSAFRYFSSIDPPTNFTAQVMGASVELKWDALLDSSLASYRVYFSTDSSATPTLLTTITDTTYTTTINQRGTEFYYAVASVDTNNVESSLSGYVSAIIPAIEVTIDSVSLADFKATIIWNAVSGADLQSYKVYQSSDTTASDSLVATLTDTSFTSDYLNRNSSYYFRVAALDTNNIESTPTSYQAFSIPSLEISGLSLQQIGFTAQLSWDSITAGDFDSFKVYQTTDTTGVKTLLSTLSDTTYTSGNLARGATYYFAVSILDSTGTEGPLSNYVLMNIPGLTPEGLTLEQIGATVKATWNQRPEGDVLTYKLYSTTDTTSTDSLIVTTSDTTFTSGELNRQETYYFRVSTVDTSNTESAKTNYETITVPGFFTVNTGTGIPGMSFDEFHAWGDYDNDGDLDLFMQGLNDDDDNSILIRLYTNDGLGVFTDQSSSLQSANLYARTGASADWGDFDNDGDLDLLYNFSSGSTLEFRIYENISIGFQLVNNPLIVNNAYPAIIGSSGVKWIDIDNDYDLDIVYSGGTSIVHIFRNDLKESNNFVDLSINTETDFIGSFVEGDFDGDGDIDFITSERNDLSSTGTLYSVKLYLNNSKGNFSKSTENIGEIYGSINAGYFNDDNRLDYVVSGYTKNLDRKTRIGFNDGSGSFSMVDIADIGGFNDFTDNDVGDFDNDGDLDILIGGGLEGTKIFQNDGVGNFSELNFQFPHTIIRTISFVDYDSDGDLDILGRGSSELINYTNNLNQPVSTSQAPRNISLDYENGIQTISWDAPTDKIDENISYNIFFKHADSLNYIVSPSADTNSGFFRLNKHGNSRTRNSFKIEIDSLDPGNYEFGVQAIDASSRGGAFLTIGKVPLGNFLTINNSRFGKAVDSMLVLSKSRFFIASNFADSNVTVYLKTNLSGSLFIDANANRTLDEGEAFTESTPITLNTLSSDSLLYKSDGVGFEELQLNFESGIIKDSTVIGFYTHETEPIITGATDQGGWYLLSNPINTTVGTLFENIWTQGAINADSESGTPNIYTFNPDSAKYIAITTDLDTTKVSAGEGILAYIFPDDNYNDANDPVNGGWPKTLSNYGNPFGENISVPIKNTDVDGNGVTSGSEGFQLMGNPYGFPVSVDSLVAELVKIDPFANRYVYRWDPINKQYNLNFTGSVDAYESFFVRTVQSGSTGNATFDYNDVHSSARLKEREEVFPIELEFYSGDLAPASYSVRLDEDASTDIDPMDGYYLGTFATRFANLYSSIGDQPLVLNNLPSGLNEIVEIPLSIHSSEIGEHSLSWQLNSVPEGWNITLENTSTNEVIDLSSDTEYSFNYQGEARQKRIKTETPDVLSFMPKKLKAKAKAVSSDLILRINPGIATGGENDLGLPTEVELEQNYPNPFNPSSVIRFGVPEQAPVQLEVFDILGRKVMSLLNGEVKQPGRYNINFDGRALASGMYIYRLVIGDKVLTKKMTLIK